MDVAEEAVSAQTEESVIAEALSAHPAQAEGETSVQTPADNADAAPEASAASAEGEAVPETNADGSPAATPNNDPALLRRTLEGLLFITDRPLSAGELAKLVNVRDQDRIVAAVEDLRRELEERNLGFHIVAVAEGWQMATRPELAPWVRKLFADRATMRLSTAAQETLSIVAYRQPLTRAEIEQIRGVEVIAALETLLEKRLLKVVGRKETVGRPLMYGTTADFLRHFGLRSLEDLPPLDSFTPAEQVPPAAAPADASAAPQPEVPAAEFVAAAEEAPAGQAAAEEAPAESAETAAEEPKQDQTDAEGSGEEPLWPK